MKVTIGIADSVFIESVKLAAEKGVSLDQLVEASLFHVLAEEQGKEFSLRDASFGGRRNKFSIS